GVDSIADEFPSEIINPFSHDAPFAALNEYQRWKLMSIWQGSHFGKRYRNGSWGICDTPLRQAIQKWHANPDHGLMLSGTMGTGKTVALGMMMACLAARNEFSFIFWHVSSLLTFLHGWRGWG